MRVISCYFAFRRGPLEMELTYDSSGIVFQVVKGPGV